jgi:hypothetical protein
MAPGHEKLDAYRYSFPSAPICVHLRITSSTVLFPLTFPCFPWFKTNRFLRVSPYLSMFIGVELGFLLLALEFETTSGTTELEIKKCPGIAFVCIRGSCPNGLLAHKEPGV